MVLMFIGNESGVGAHDRPRVGSGVRQTARKSVLLLYCKYRPNAEFPQAVVNSIGTVFRGNGTVTALLLRRRKYEEPRHFDNFS